MRVSRERASQNRARVIDAAGKLFRQRGFEGVAVADIMRAAGLTHGGFYGQFGSKDDLAAESCARALDCSGDKWEQLIRGDPAGALAAIADTYLSAGHRDDSGSSCLVSALAVDVSRRDGRLREVFTAGLGRLFDLLERALPSRIAADRRRKALATMASLVGAVVLARAVDDAALSDEILAATAEAVGVASADMRIDALP